MIYCGASKLLHLVIYNFNTKINSSEFTDFRAKLVT